MERGIVADSARHASGPPIPPPKSPRRSLDNRSETGSIIETINKLRHHPSTPMPRTRVSIDELLAYPKDDDFPKDIEDNKRPRQPSGSASIDGISPARKRSRLDKPLPRVPGSDKPLPLRPTSAYASIAQAPSLANLDENAPLSVLPGRSTLRRERSIGVQTEVCSRHLCAL